MPRTPDTLQKTADRSRRTELADQLHIADINTQFERSRRNQHLQLAAFEALLGIQPLLFRQAAVMRRDGGLAEPLSEMARNTLGHPARVHEHERGAVLRDQIGEAVVDTLAHIVRHDCFERNGRQFECEIALAHMADIDDRTRSIASQELRDEFDRLLRRR
jgi:hypothetical protein